MHEFDPSVEKIKGLEYHYRSCACRSMTPFFSERNEDESPFSHKEDETGEIYRTFYQHDRDKILYSRSFRRLRLKCQMFPEHIGEYFRTRLDHTLEVAQIARHYARQLYLNEDLVDAIALAHDLGHTPFGHSGERALHNYLLRHYQNYVGGSNGPGFDGFKHNWQSLRIVDKLDNSYPERYGLNLTRAVRIGILKHCELTYSSNSDQSCSCDMKETLANDFNPEDKCLNIFEVQLVAFADEIAQVIHDFEDAILSGTYHLEAIVPHNTRDDWPLIGKCLYSIENKAKNNTGEVSRWSDLSKIDFSDTRNRIHLIERLRSEFIYKITVDTINITREKIDTWEKNHIKGESLEYKIDSYNKFIEQGEPFDDVVNMDEFEDDFNKLSEKIKKEVINSERISRLDGKADFVISKLLDIFRDKPKQLPQAVLEHYAKESEIDDVNQIRMMSKNELNQLKIDKKYIRTIIDYIAEMTDRTALREYDQLYSAYPKSEM